jgi:hypothetical protein|tara:strand:+ start:275 stop:763 length:489 start_codon:yes stop_codon:yes gene_type:complete
MASSYTTRTGIEKPATGEQSGTWGDTTNLNFDIIDTALNGVVTLSLSGTSSSLTTSDGTVSDGMNKLIVCGGSPSGTHTITIAPNDAEKIYFVTNDTNQSVVFSQGSGANVTVATGESRIIRADGAGGGAAVTDFTSTMAASTTFINNTASGDATALAIALG